MSDRHRLSGAAIAMQVPVCSQRGSWSAILHVPGLSLTRLSLLPSQAWPCLSNRLQHGSWRCHRRRKQPVQYTAAAYASLPSTTWLFSAGTLYCVPLFLLVSSCCCAPAQRRALLCLSHLALLLLLNPVHIVSSSKVGIRAAELLTRYLGLQMLLLPRWPITHRLMKGYAVFLPLSAIYIVLLARSWTPDMLQLMMPGSLNAGLSGLPMMCWMSACQAHTATCWCLQSVCQQFSTGQDRQVCCRWLPSAVLPLP